jgi:hypothetical protein
LEGYLIMRTSIIVSSVATLGVAISLGLSATAGATATCLNGSDHNSFRGTYTRGTGTITTKGGAPICKDSTIVLSSFTLADTWNKQYTPYTYANMTAYPQTMFAETTTTFPGGKANHSMTVKVATPEKCKSIQMDFYVGTGYKTLDGPKADEARNVNGLIINGEGTCAVVTPPKETPTPTPVPTPTPPVKTPTPTPTPETPAAVVETPAELPKTGMSSILLPFGIATALGTAVATFKRR